MKEKSIIDIKLIMETKAKRKEKKTLEEKETCPCCTSNYNNSYRKKL